MGIKTSSDRVLKWQSAQVTTLFDFLHYYIYYYNIIIIIIKKESSCHYVTELKKTLKYGSNQSYLLGDKKSGKKWQRDNKTRFI